MTSSPDSGSRTVLMVDDDARGTALLKENGSMRALVDSPTCQDRQWLDDDEAMATGPICGAPATHCSCTAVGPADALNACKAHKCRCAPELIPRRITK
jgi:hypothetical protein